jgi:hypothetical protein
MGKEGGREYLVAVQALNVLLYQIDKLSQVLLYAPRIYTSVIQPKDHDSQRGAYVWPNKQRTKL